MPVSNAQQLEIDKLADKAIKAWEWSLGTDVNPSIMVRRSDRGLRERTSCHPRRY